MRITNIKRIEGGTVVYTAQELFISEKRSICDFLRDNFLNAGMIFFRVGR